MALEHKASNVKRKPVQSLFGPHISMHSKLVKGTIPFLPYPYKYKTLNLDKALESSFHPLVLDSDLGLRAY